METSGRRSWRQVIAVASVSLLVVLPFLAFAAVRPPNVRDGKTIFEQIIARLCKIQQAHGNRVTLVDPSLCAPPAPPPVPTPPPPAPTPTPPSPEPTPPPPPPPPPSPEPTPPPPPPEGSVVINEIMYAPSGADAGHEWIEVANGTAGAIDFSGWKFFENGTNHGLVLSQGSATISAGGFAIIADNAVEFLVDYPDFAGALFDSAFSLGNDGETIALTDENGSSVGEVTYSSSQGALDDGNSLQRTSEGWTAATPTPGS